MKVFSIKEASKILNISQHTLRYYEKFGIIQIKRRRGTNVREFTRKDIEWLEYIKALKDIGFSLEKIKEYSALKMNDKETLGKRKEVLKDHRTKVHEQIKLLEEIRDNIDNKISCIESREETHED